MLHECATVHAVFWWHWEKIQQKINYNNLFYSQQKMQYKFPKHTVVPDMGEYKLGKQLPACM